MISKVFTDQDQAFFAALSGDWNPMHMDPVAARRTQAGLPAVHGIHGLLWGLENAPFSALGGFGALQARFEQFIHPGDEVGLSLCEEGQDRVSVSLGVGGRVATNIVWTRAPKDAASLPLPSGGVTIGAAAEPIWCRSIAEVASLSGTLQFAGSLDSYAEAFPGLSARIGPARIGALAALSRLVGMICPGLHSIFLSVDVAFVPEPENPTVLAFQVKRAHPKFHRILMAVEGGGIAGTIECLMRAPPVMQLAAADALGWVASDAFAGSRALIVGGSRGLGEVTAKLIAAGGGHPIITYALGRADAEAVAADIGQAGGTCDVLPFDFRLEAKAQLGALAPPSHLYYFATPRIARQQGALYSPELFAEFNAAYNDSFYRLCALFAREETPIRAFYPSSVFVEQRPRQMTEYAMAKSAGEILCADMNAHMRGVHVELDRLPRLLTDQTASTSPVQMDSAADVIKPVILRMHG